MDADAQRRSAGWAGSEAGRRPFPRSSVFFRHRVKWIATFKLLVASLLAAGPVCAQATYTPVIAGTLVSCRDASGTPVVTEVIGTLPDMAMSRILPNRVPAIDINPSAFGAANSLLQLFAYAHECGHHSSGDVIALTYYRHLNPEREKTADRIGIRTLRDKWKMSRADAEVIASSFQGNPAYPGYLPGPLRAQWILECFDTNNDTCSQDGSERPSPPLPSPSSQCDADLQACKQRVGTQNECIHADAQDCQSQCNGVQPCYGSCLNSKNNPTSCIRKVRSGRNDCEDAWNQCRAVPNSTGP
jgi:hypothetical protein